MEEHSPVALPPGFSLVRTGGAPRKTARDVAVYLAYLYHLDALGKAQLVYELMLGDGSDGRPLFDGLCSDPAKIRQKVRNARRALPQTGGTVLYCFGALFYDTPAAAGSRPSATWASYSRENQPAVRHTARLPQPPVGSVVWAWRVGDAVALEGRTNKSWSPMTIAIGAQRVGPILASPDDPDLWSPDPYSGP